MNILNRKMFVNGGPAQAEPSIPELIGYYVSQGYNAFQIKEMLPDLDMSDIEAAVSQLGGSVNPAVSSPGADEFEGNFNVLPQIPETTVTANQDGMTTMNPSFPPEPDAPQEPGLPKTSFGDLENIINRLKTRREEISAQANQGLNRMFPDRFLKDSMGDILPVGSTIEDYDTAIAELESILQSSIAGYGMSPQSVPENINIDEMMMDPSRPSPEDLLTIDDGLPEITGIGADSSLGDNQYRDSEGVVHDISSEKLRELLNGESSRIISGVLSNPNVSYGLEIAKIIEAEALGRSSTLVDPSLIKVGVQDIVLNPESITDETLKLGVDFVKEGAEGFFNTIKGLGNSRMVGIFRGREAAKKAKDAGRDEYKNIFDTPLSGQGSIADNLREISGYGNTGGETAKTLDSIILEASLSPPTGIDANLKDLEDIAADDVKDTTKEETPTTDDDATGTPTTDGDVETEDGAIKGASTDPKGTGDKPGEDSEEDKLDSIITVADENDQAEQLSQSLGFFQQQDTQRLIRNIGKGLTQYGNFAEGIGVGTAAAAEERVLEEQLDAKRVAELAKLQADSKMSVGDNEKVLNSKSKLNDYIKDYNNAIAAEELTTSILGILSDPSENITSFTNKIGVSIDEFLNAAGQKDLSDFEAMKPGQRAKAMLKVLTNRDIKEILGESGRTISNIDREIAGKIMGQLELFTIEDSVGTMKFKLEENLRSITTKKSLAQRNIKANSSFIAEYDPKSIFDDIELLYILNKELGYNLSRQTSVPTPSSNSNDIQLDITGQ